MDGDKVLTDLLPAPAHRPIREMATAEQERYAFLKVTTSLTQRQIAEQLGVHPNTISNWNKTDVVKRAIREQIEEVRKDNAIGVQRLMQTMVTNAIELLNSDIGNTTKVQLIGQLFGQVGKLSGLEPPKQVQKHVKVEKSFEQLLDAEVDYEVED